MARAGRRPGPTETPEAILAAARELFAASGYQSTTIRAVAARAGVNSALVHHYFRTKADLFIAAVDVPINPGELISELLATGPVEDFPERFARAFLAQWRDPIRGARLQALLRSAASTEEGAILVRSLAENVVLARAATALGVPKLNVALAMTQLIGLALGAFVVRIEPLKSASEDDLVALIGPAIRTYLSQRRPIP